MMNDTTPTRTPDDLRAALVTQLAETGAIRTEPVRTAFATVPRHRFLPAHPPQEAYTNKYVVTHHTAGGEAISSISQPSVVAMQLEQLDVRPGMRVLEIGAGTGYNAALMDELVGPGGKVVSIDIEPDVTAAAQVHLLDTGHDRVDVITGDGADGASDQGPFDRIIATTGVWDIPPAWWDQLAPGGRMVIPLRWRALTRSLTLEQVDDRLIAREVRLCGFIPMQGQDGEKAFPLAEGVTVHFDQDTPVDEALARALDTSRTEAWSGVRITGETPLEGVWMQMACTEPGTGRMVTKPPALGTDLVKPAIPPLNPILVNKGSLAYLSVRKISEEEPRLELGAIGHGPEGHHLAERICEQVRRWDSNRDGDPNVTVYRKSELPQVSEGTVIEKDSSVLVVSMSSGNEDG
ncbi:methyltransferase, FxLD system [Nocardiopsis exhalans]|uniref:Protein-L-isoaspartate O-methyltransferase n=1 Tax=Nocardiopsis exhalans TaxID=163604 RepID=A0ABY5D8N8_9ACTN|nr:methyltransferase, FxLD system [Nocardiopsis exhalans]USY20702.1 methyltransferase, FxLD system [Nocardiopsis exhalans]